MSLASALEAAGFSPRTVREEHLTLLKMPGGVAFSPEELKLRKNRSMLFYYKHYEDFSIRIQLEYIEIHIDIGQDNLEDIFVYIGTKYSKERPYRVYEPVLDFETISHSFEMDKLEDSNIEEQIFKAMQKSLTEQNLLLNKIKKSLPGVYP